MTRVIPVIYPVYGMVAFAIAGILTPSTFLLRRGGYLFPFTTLASIALFWSVIDRNTEAFQGLVALDLLFIAFVATGGGIYIARIHRNVMAHPIFIVDRAMSTIARRACEDGVDAS